MTISSANEQAQIVMSKVKVKGEADSSYDNYQVIPKLEVKNEPDSSFDLNLSSIPSYASSPKTQTDKGVVVKGETSSARHFSAANEIATSSALPTQQVKEFSLTHVRGVARSTDLEKLEASVSIGLDILRKLGPLLIDANRQDFLSDIENLQKKGKPARTIVSVAGATGAGKSSLINAVLCEEKLLPTNGMRACTAVVTEISYNHDEDHEQPYGAEVEFISKNDWSSELNILFGELVNEDQLCSTYRDPNTEAGVAYAKIRAVYPYLSHEMLVQSNREQLVGKAEVQQVLGTTITSKHRTASDLYKTLQMYLDSKERQSRSTEIAFWPLIKVVRIYCRADALSTGLCIVDLPGIQDSNAARSAVAKRYMADCSAVWFASPIKRAVDDKAAKDLLGESSRTQLKMDGMYSNVTFICTCSDIFEVSEIQDSLDPDNRISTNMQEEHRLNTLISETAEEVDRLRNDLDELEAHCAALENSQQVWERLMTRHEKGQKVYAPAPDVPGRSRKRRRRTTTQSSTATPSNQEPLTADQISQKLEELKEQNEAKGTECDELDHHLQLASTRLEDMEQKKADLTAVILKLCVQRRNEFCKDTIRADFAAGIREHDGQGELDDEEYEPENGQEAHASAEQRDYDEIARCLPVYAISSKAYQQLRSTKRQLGIEAKGFSSLKDTEVPALQAHAKAMSNNGRVMASRAFLNGFAQLLSTIELYLNSSSTELLEPRKGLAQERTNEVKVLETEVANLKRQINEQVHALRKSLHDLLRQGPNDTSSGAQAFAVDRIEEIVVSWSLRENMVVGACKGLGLAWNTYKAICRRMGAKTSNSKSKDFNDEILGPFMMKLSTSWEQTFVRSIPAALDDFGTVCAHHLKTFHEQAMARPTLARATPASLRTLDEQLQDHVAIIDDAILAAKRAIQSEQRHASRLFYPEVRKQMMEAYDQCIATNGTGSYTQMKKTMLDHVKQNKDIYRKSHRAVIKDIENTFSKIVMDLLDQVEKICALMCKNYGAVITCSQMIQASVAVRENLRKMLLSVDSKFEAIAIPNEQAVNIDSTDALSPTCDLFVPQGTPEGDELSLSSHIDLEAWN